MQDKKNRFTMKNMKFGTKENMFNHEIHEKARKKISQRIMAGILPALIRWLRF